MNSSIIIREIDSISEMKALEQLQKDVWGWDDLDTMPLMNFIVTKEVGGVLIGAFDGETPVGFCFGFVGSHDGHIIFHSHMLAVLPQFREHGIGQKLKLAQREHALAKGFTCITWTFDPLQSPNAYLNFTKLGVIANDYRINFYGEKTSSALHRFIGTDRLWVNWFLESERVRKRVEGGIEPSPEELEKHVSLVTMSADGSPETRALVDRDHLLIDVPADIGVLQQQDPELAVAWRNATRAAFTVALAAGYTVEEFYRIEREGQSAGCYLLSSHGANQNTN
jgi:predicted GNAT superfamily acetyltransferase